MNKKILSILLCIICAIGLLLDAKQIKADEMYQVKRVLNGKSFTLKNGKTVRLASIQVPNIQETHGLKRPGQPMGKQSHQALIDIIQNRLISLEYGKEPEDRKGRWLAVAKRKDGTVVQEEMIKQGWAITYPFPDLTKPIKKWLSLENNARENKLGIWKNSYWDPQDADGVDTNGKERYLLVEGTIKNIAKVKGTWFLNFDDDWKTDFTATIGKDDAKAYFKKYDIKSLEGKKVRVRGWVYRYNGPAVDIHQPEQIEILQ